MNAKSKRVLAGLCSVVIVALTFSVFAGSELPKSTDGVCRAAGDSRLPKKKIGPPAGDYCVSREAPLPVPRRRVGQGFRLYPDYGPTYYFPAAYHRYEGVNPKYYPFYVPRLWPNYKSEAQRPRGNYCGISRSGWQWDEYDDWVRGGRYEERSE
ncbi:MAG: hypothetical protein N2Z21_10510 [Candidatus Sumerlaeaceae bacterium]|nr:hypothetical protein [Candidatus Sumerlaeaceae bacterium]